MEQRFEVITEDRVFRFKMDEEGYVWIIGENEQLTNYGQTRPARDFEEAKEIAKLMLQGLGRKPVQINS